MTAPLSPPAYVCFQLMSALEVRTRAEAIEFLRSAIGVPRLSIEEIRSVIDAFPVLPEVTGDVAYDRTDPGDEVAQGTGRPRSGARYGPDGVPDGTS